MKNQNRRLIAVLCSGAALMSSCHPATTSYASPPPSASSRLELTVPTSKRDALVAALRKAVSQSLGQTPASVQVTEEGGYPGPAGIQAAPAGVDLYTSALDDAQRKADAIVKKLHGTLGGVQSIAEQVESYPAPGMQALKGNAPASIVRVSANQPVVLYVTFAASGGNAPTIGVYGFSSFASNAIGPPPSAFSKIFVSVDGHGSDIASAIQALTRTEDLIRKTALASGLQPSAIELMGEDFNRP